MSLSHSGVFTGVEFFLLHLAVFVPGCDPVVPDLESAYCCLQLYNISTGGFYSYCSAPDVQWQEAVIRLGRSIKQELHVSKYLQP